MAATDTQIIGCDLVVAARKSVLAPVRTSTNSTLARRRWTASRAFTARATRSAWLRARGVAS